MLSRRIFNKIVAAIPFSQFSNYVPDSTFDRIVNYLNDPSHKYDEYNIDILIKDKCAVVSIFMDGVKNVFGNNCNGICYFSMDDPEELIFKLKKFEYDFSVTEYNDNYCNVKGIYKW